MNFYLSSAAIKDERISAQQARIETLQQELNSKAGDMDQLQKKIRTLEKRVFLSVLEHGTADRIVIEKKARRLMLMSKGEVIKSYKIALGGNPEGPGKGGGQQNAGKNLRTEPWSR